MPTIKPRDADNEPERQYRVLCTSLALYLCLAGSRGCRSGCRFGASVTGSHRQDLLLPPPPSTTSACRRRRRGTKRKRKVELDEGLWSVPTLHGCIPYLGSCRSPLDNFLGFAHGQRTLQQQQLLLRLRENSHSSQQQRQRQRHHHRDG